MNLRDKSNKFRAELHKQKFMSKIYEFRNST